MADRPLECTQCKRPIAVDYTEIVEGQEVQLSMCSVCPVLQRMLHGTAPQEEMPAGKTTAGLYCGNCNTSLDDVKTGNPLGCAQCYEVFADVITFDLLSAHRISRRLRKPTGKGTPLHIGRTPGQKAEISPTIQRVALEEALEATLKSEDYEGAAWLRDQIAKEKNEG